MDTNMDNMERVTTRQAAKELSMDVETVHYLMQVERLPIGYAVKKEGKKRYSYYIYRSLLDRYKKKVLLG